jgi:hypothetical protein
MAIAVASYGLRSLGMDYGTFSTEVLLPQRERRHKENTMRHTGTRWRWVAGVGIGIATGLLGMHASLADEVQECLEGQVPKIIRGLHLTPVPLNFEQTNVLLVGLGSYIVNAQGGCNDCHTNPPYAPGGDPFQGEPEQINAETYLAGGQEFGPFTSRNLTPCTDGKPAGLTFEEFTKVMRTGVDLKDGQTGPPDTPILQVMPWPVYGKMTRCDLRAIYEFLRAIPPHDSEGCMPAG